VGGLSEVNVGGQICYLCNKHLFSTIDMVHGYVAVVTPIHCISICGNKITGCYVPYFAAVLCFFCVDIYIYSNAFYLFIYFIKV